MYETHSDKGNLSAGKNILKNILVVKKKVVPLRPVCVRK
jgi:hypothetical protein